MTTTEDVFEAKRAKTQAAYATYDELRSTLHVHPQPTVEDIDVILKASEKTWDDLKSDSARAQRREALKKQLQDAGLAKAEISRLQELAVAEKEAFEQLHADHKSKLRPIYNAIDDAEAIVTAAAAVPSLLHQTRWVENDPPSSLKWQIQQLEDAKNEAARRLTNIQSRETHSRTQAERSIWNERQQVAQNELKKASEAVMVMIAEQTRLQAESDNA